MDYTRGIVLPFEFVGKLPSFTIALAGRPECFILDSGAPQMVLNSGYEVNPDALRPVKIAGAGGKTSEVYIKTIPSFTWGELTLRNQTALALDLSHMEEKLGVKIRGLIGYEAIKDFDILYDYAGKTITLIPPQAAKTEGAGLLYPLLSCGHPHIPVIPVNIHNTEYYMGIDCGAETNLLDARYWDSLCSAGAFISQSDAALTDISKADAGVKSGELGPVVVYDKLRFNAMSFLFSDISHLKTGGDTELDGIIGYELLSEIKVLLSYARKEIVFI